MARTSLSEGDKATLESIVKPTAAPAEVAETLVGSSK
eukprot:CAMPEP_0198115992 /NCGR_PEP_ID=MMETSP1442-20131203/9017_1 /TAXON_ID= /ORGANISM="Craspedostauros australis, Strain CCMP3328" /LENGTH=36 /DNA_ID= /DNA_START= /DNA_END= /DNA_ORIENTATION=